MHGFTRGKNEAILDIGIADADNAEEQIDWPSAQTTALLISDLDRRWIIVEGEQEPFQDSVIRS